MQTSTFRSHDEPENAGDHDALIASAALCKCKETWRAHSPRAPCSNAYRAARHFPDSAALHPGYGARESGQRRWIPAFAGMTRKKRVPQRHSRRIHVLP